MTYSSSLFSRVDQTVINTNINYTSSSSNYAVREVPKVLVIPEIVISESRDEEATQFDVPLVVPRRVSEISDSNNENVPQRIENECPLSIIEGEDQVPQLSMLLGKC